MRARLSAGQQEDLVALLRRVLVTELQLIMLVLVLVLIQFVLCFVSSCYMASCALWKSLQSSSTPSRSKGSCPTTSHQRVKDDSCL